MAASDGVRGAKVSRLAFPPSEWRNHRLLVLMAITPMSGTAYVAEESIIWSTGETTPWRCALGTGQNVPGTRGGSRRERQIAALVIRSFKGLSAIDFHAFGDDDSLVPHTSIHPLSPTRALLSSTLAALS
ncbi:unnamed protein product [Diplocarpon coronariae]|uniref:Uncharacterized protein n=1 Tax=Diplocarpon coronariae TaxID=2795749 RepID=A0A218ZCJ3_9HELO|nr:hypothetical protein B2J93_907 [Marssonina coronariae]